MSTLFEDLDPTRVVWGRNRDSAKWHIVGPRLPRLAPVSWRHVVPCGEAALYGDGLKTSQDPPYNQRCFFCNRLFELRRNDALRAAQK